MNVTEKNGNAYVEGCGCFSLALSCDCGQAFRWIQNEDGCWSAVVAGRYVRVCQPSDETLVFYATTADEFNSLWLPYFDLGRDYSAVIKTLSADSSLAAATAQCSGIHILRQEPWETLCSFIISQNNNIPRIKGIISRLCETFGEKTAGGFSFPSAQRLAPLEPNDLAPLRAGFRAKYIIDAARKVSNGEVNFEKIAAQPLDFGREELQKICGVGAKVAECTLLYGFGKVDAFPVDVWVKRILSEMYPDGFPECADGVKGIAQQYLFHWRRNYF